MADLVTSITGTCSKCQEFSNLRRNLCPHCYVRWLRSRPIGVGACCTGCGDRRLVHLQYVELQQGFAVVCRNCAAQLEREGGPPPADEEEVRALLQRERREVQEEDRRRDFAEDTSPGEERRQRLVDRRAPHYDAEELVIAEEPERLPPPPAEAVHRAAPAGAGLQAELSTAQAYVDAYLRTDGDEDDELDSPPERAEVTRVHFRG